MGMSASQARLLSITARLSDNEASAQAVSFAKQRLADETQQINEAYNKALMKTKISAITGYNDSGAVLEDISYALLTDERVRTGKQYVITDTKGRVLVDNNVAKAFRASNGDVNIFLAEMGYTQASNNITQANATSEQQAAIEQEIENAWDKYYASVGIKFPDEEHDYSMDALTFNYVVNGDYGHVTVKKASFVTVPSYVEDSTVNGLYLAASTTDTHKIMVGDTKFNAINPNFGHVDWSVPTIIPGTATQPNDYATNPEFYYHDTDSGMYYKYCFEQIGATEPNDFNENDYFISNGTYYRYTNTYTSNGQAIVNPNTGDTFYLMNGTFPASQYVPNGTWQEGGPYLENGYLINRNVGNEIPLNYEGASSEQRELYDYAVALTKSYYVGASYDTVSTAQPSTLELKSTADDPAYKANINYYKNLFYKMQLSGCYSYTNTGAGDENTIRVDDLAKTVMKDSALLQEKIKSGELYLEFFSASEKKFVSTTLGQDDTITEVEDESAIARAEVKYEQDLTALEQRDKKFDLQLKKLDTEHSTLQTEYDCIKQIISKNVQNSFKTFNG